MSSKSEMVREFYSKYPYPFYGHTVKIKGVKQYSKYCRMPGRFLDAGCGTGHTVVGAARLLPHLEFWGIDFSQPSLKIAEEVARRHNVKVHFCLHNLMEPLPFDFKFDYINCTGTLHHLESPEVGLRNLAAHLAGNGYIFIHLYGEDYHRRRLQVREMLESLLPNCTDEQRRYEYYLAYKRHRSKGPLETIYDFSPRQGVRYIKGLIADLRFFITRRDPLSAENYNIQNWDGEYRSVKVTERWLDQFAHPNEKIFNVRDVEQLVKSAGLEIVEMFSRGRYQPKHLPREWKIDFFKLPETDRYRIMELLVPSHSFFFAAKKKE